MLQKKGKNSLFILSCFSIICYGFEKHFLCNMKNKEFPNLNDQTKAIFDEFAEIYRTEVLENGMKEVQNIAKQYSEKSTTSEIVID